MPPSRNEPCHCGSGKKYKHCCLDTDTSRARSLRLVHGEPSRNDDGISELSVPLDALHALDRSDHWELDAVPVPMLVDGDVPGRTCVRLLVANGFVLDAFVDAAPPSEPGDVAVMLLDWMRTAVARHRAKSGAAIPMPDYLLVRHESVARAMVPLLLPETKVRHSHLLPEIDRAASSLRNRLGMSASEAESDMATEQTLDEAETTPGLSLISFPQVWSAWNIDHDALRTLFAAAAVFHSAAPWTRLENEETLSVTSPDDPAARWTACIMGAGGEEFGLVLYERDNDFARLLREGHPEDMLRGIEGAVITLYFDPRSALPRGMQTEFRQHGWSVAGPDAYPLISCANTPAGGITRAQVALLTNALAAIARLAREKNVLPTENTPRAEPVEWLDVESGLLLGYRGSRSLSAVRLWEEPTVLVAGAATGPAADSNALFLRELDSEEALDAAFAPLIARLDAFAEWIEQSRGERLRARGGTAPDTHMENAQMFVEHLAFGHGVTLAAIHEYHLRIFLYDWVPSRIRRAERESAGILATLRKLFAWMESIGIVCPWAAAILDDRSSLDVRIATVPPGMAEGAGPIWWSDQLSQDLHRRVMLPAPLLSEEDGVDDGGLAGPREIALFEELVARNLAWREAGVAAGVCGPDALRAACVAAQQQWETQKHRLYGKSPASVVRQERRKSQRN